MTDGAPQSGGSGGIRCESQCGTRIVEITLVSRGTRHCSILPACLRIFHLPLFSTHANERLIHPVVANERTFLGYLRTSVILSMMGIFIAQLCRLSHSPSPDPVFGYFVVSKPLSAIFQGSALGTVLFGAFRYWRHQNAMLRGKACVGGWEMLAAASYLFTVSRRSAVKVRGNIDADLYIQLMLAVFAVHLGIPVYKSIINVH